MGKTFEIITSELKSWIELQKVFFVATAPLAANGNVNCSPKGGDTLRVLDGNRVAYLDLTGSGIETVAHVQENGRIAIMFCAFEGPPKIVRLHGKGEVVYPANEAFKALSVNFREHLAARAIVLVTVTRISDSCGFGVPLMSFLGERDLIGKWAEKTGREGLQRYRFEKNRQSIDGIEGLRAPNMGPGLADPRHG
jgi:hypothetical protein